MGVRPVWRVRDRASFDTLRRDGRRSRRGPVSVTFAPTPGPPRVAFAIGRPVGGAVERNRLRRRLRAAVDDLARRGDVPPGTYLVTARAEALALTPAELRSAVALSVAEVAE
jgi:ribonuclease P protein component